MHIHSVTCRGHRSAPSAAVMSVLQEAEVPTEVQEIDFEELVSEQLDAYKKTTSKTLNWPACLTRSMPSRSISKN